jgi:archaellum component FlaG (FlaF/FlaG flagellin family)
MMLAQWIQIIFSGALVLATGILAFITYRYMKATKKMAESMDVQSKIMAREFDLRVVPIINITSGISKTCHENGEYSYFVSNGGHYSVTLTKVDVIFKHKKDLSIIIPSFTKDFNISINPGSSKDINLQIDFTEFNKLFPNVQAKHEVSLQPIFKIRNVENKEFEFKGGLRTVWQ